MLNEADTRAKLVDSKPRESGWKEEMIERGRHISPGRLIDEMATVREEQKSITFYIIHQCPYL
jgi:hypothetical protein